MQLASCWLACAWADTLPSRAQFFITLDKSPWLERKHTIFGKVRHTNTRLDWCCACLDSWRLQVTGTTIYNALKIGELEVEEGTDRPAEPPTIQRIEVVWNPFEDITPRNMKPLPSEVVVGGTGDAPVERKRKNLALLSFGDEAEEEEEAIAAAPRARVKSIHDAVEDDARLVKAGTSAEAELREKEVRSRYGYRGTPALVLTSAISILQSARTKPGSASARRARCAPSLRAQRARRGLKAAMWSRRARRCLRLSCASASWTSDVSLATPSELCLRRARTLRTRTRTAPRRRRARERRRRAKRRRRSARRRGGRARLSG